jgi:nitrile hydratase accessory protein
MNDDLDHRYPEFPADMKIPLGSDGDPVFAEPWEARAFALVVSAHDQGRFEWQDFQRLLVTEIRHSEAHCEPRSYYLNWAMAAEKLFESLGSLQRSDVDQRVTDLRPDDKTVRI